MTYSFRHLLTAFAIFFALSARSQQNPLTSGSEEIYIWPAHLNDKVNTERVRIAETGDHVISHINKASITYFPADPQEATGAAIIIAPGGGHVELWIDHEGYRPARWLSEHGIAAFVLKYQLGKEPGSSNTVDGTSVGDIQRAIRVVRSRAKAWGIDPARIGVMGFSAGGELAALAAMWYDSVRARAYDSIDQQNSRPDFQVLIYPGHSERFTVTKRSPPVFILCGGDDTPSISEGMPKLYLKYKTLGVPAELHIYAGTSHGFGMRDTNKGAIADWPQRLYEWMQGMKIIGRAVHLHETGT